MNSRSPAIDKMPSARRRPLRFLVAGAINTLASYGSYVLLVMLEFNLPTAGLLSLLVGIATGFVTQGRFVFGNLSRASLVRYVLAWAVLYGLHLGIVMGLLQFGISPYMGALAALAVLTVLSYFVLRDLVFRTQP